MKAAIVYRSFHQGNTKKLVDAIAGAYPVDVFDAGKVKELDLADYDVIGFASGVYVERPSRRVTELIERCLPAGRCVFLMYTCGSPNDKYMEPWKKLVAEKKCELVGVYGAKGYYDLLIRKGEKGRPNTSEIQGAAAFYGEIAGEKNHTDRWR